MSPPHTVHNDDFLVSIVVLRGQIQRQHISFLERHAVLILCLELLSDKDCESIFGQGDSKLKLHPKLYRESREAFNNAPSLVNL